MQGKNDSSNSHSAAYVTSSPIAKILAQKRSRRPHSEDTILIHSISLSAPLIVDENLWQNGIAMTSNPWVTGDR